MQCRRSRYDAFGPVGPVHTGVVTRYFGLAPHFAWTKRHVETGHFLVQIIVANPFAGHPKGLDLEVVQWF
jgi:hypothetical protein